MKISYEKLEDELRRQNVALPKGLLVFSHDLSYAFTKTTEAIAFASQRLGIPTVLRDSFDARACHLALAAQDDEKFSFSDEAAKDIARRWDALMDDFGLDAVLALDLGWLVLPDYFLDHPRVRKIYSIWFDEFHSWCRTQTNAIFPYRKRQFQQLIANPRILHCFYGEAMARECRLMGIGNQAHSNLAAPAEYLTANFPCEVTDKLVFIGNPGFRGAPHPDIVKRLHEGAELKELREISRAEILYSVDQKIWPWLSEEPTIKNLVGFATSMKMESPYISALEILDLCKEAFPVAFEYLNESGNILSIAWLVKLMNRYDRPGLVCRLYSKGLADVVSNQDEWQPYDVKSEPSIFGDEMPKWYMKYFAHINAANPIRDATANEKLFEIAACSRVSINLNSHDVRSCYGEDEIVMVNSLQEAEDAARDLIANPDKALKMGKRARYRTSQEHTWDHRLANLFKNHL